VRILEITMDRKHPRRPESTRAVTIKVLERATSSAMSSFYKDKKISEVTKAAKVGILREIFRVAKKQEQYNYAGLCEHSCSYLDI
jgi:hypothetical protein